MSIVFYFKGKFCRISLDYLTDWRASWINVIGTTAEEISKYVCYLLNLQGKALIIQVFKREGKKENICGKIGEIAFAMDKPSF